MPVNFNDLNPGQEVPADDGGIHMHFHYQQAQEEDLQSIASESSFESLRTTSAYSNLTSEQINEMAAKISNMAGFDKYKGKTIRAIEKYKAYFSHFFKIHCIDAAKTYITNLSKERYVSLNCALTDPSGQHTLDFSRINPILQNHSNNITIDYVINLAIKLNVGNIKATYTGERTQPASYGCSDAGNWVFNCHKTPAWAGYVVQISYELPITKITVPLMSLKFINQPATYHYIYQACGRHSYNKHGDIAKHADSGRAEAACANNIPLATFLQSYWGGSNLVDNSIVIQPIPGEMLSRIIEEVATYALANRSREGQNFRRSLLENKRKFYSAKLDKIDAQYNLILAYARFAGVSQENIAQIHNPLVRKQFNQDLINLSLAEHAPDGSESLFEKSRKMADTFRQQIEQLLFPDPDSEASSDEEVEQKQKHKPQPSL